MQGALVDGKGEMWHSLAHHTIMFSLLADKLDNTFRRLRGLGKISEKNIADALRDIRLALLEADVEFGVAREFIGRVKERAMGQEVLKSIKPGEQIVKIFRDEIAALLGGDAVGLDLTDPARIMVVGLNGAGKTTTSAKLALRLKNEGRRPLLVACDLVRPAAVDQLATLAEQIGVPVYKPAPGSRDVVAVAREALEWARTQNGTVMIFDTAGRQEVDEALIDELRHLHSFLAPRETLLVADAATGQQAVNVAQTFDRAVNVTGIVLTKLDGDARGGAALSMRSVTGKPIKFSGEGEKLDQFGPFVPGRMADRILGMGDIVGLVEHAAARIDEEQAAKSMDRMMSGKFDFNDFGSDEDDAEPGTAGRTAGPAPRLRQNQETASGRRPGPQADEAHGGHCALHDGQGKEQSQPVESVPPPPHCRGLRPSPDGGEQANQEFFRNAQDDVRQG